MLFMQKCQRTQSMCSICASILTTILFQIPIFRMATIAQYITMQTNSQNSNAKQKQFESFRLEQKIIFVEMVQS